MIALTASQIAEAVGGTLSETLDPETVLTAVTPDSREVAGQDGVLYVAKPGERADGHDFIDAALSAGACAVLAERGTAAPDGLAIGAEDEAVLGQQRPVAAAGDHRREAGRHHRRARWRHVQGGGVPQLQRQAHHLD